MCPTVEASKKGNGQASTDLVVAGTLCLFSPVGSIPCGDLRSEDTSHPQWPTAANSGQAGWPTQPLFRLGLSRGGTEIFGGGWYRAAWRYHPAVRGTRATRVTVQWPSVNRVLMIGRWIVRGRRAAKVSNL